MAVKQALDEALKEAMRSKNEAALGAIRGLKSSLKLAEIEKKRDFTDEEVHGLIQSAIKQRRDSIESFKSGGRTDLVASEQAQIEVLSRFLPAQLSEAEVADLVNQAVAATQATQAKDMGKVMGWLMPKVRGKAEGSLVNALVKKKLGG
jgi:uncharacterized protein YqeY